MTEVALKKTNWIRIILLIVGLPLALIALLWVGMLIYFLEFAPSSLSSQPVSRGMDYNAFRRLTENSIRSSMNDPASTQFKDVRQGTSDAVVCGLVNARNGFGGYGAFRRFYANSNLPALEIEPMSPDDQALEPKFEENYALNCDVRFGK